MANRNFNPVQAPETEVKILTGAFVGKNGSSPTVVEGIVQSVVRAGEGDYDVTLKPRHRYPGGSKLFHAVVVVGAIGDHAEPSAYDEEAGTLTVSSFLKDGTADDVADKRVEILLVVRNSTSRRGA